MVAFFPQQTVGSLRSVTATVLEAAEQHEPTVTSKRNAAERLLLSAGRFYAQENEDKGTTTVETSHAAATT